MSWRVQLLESYMIWVQADMNQIGRFYMDWVAETELVNNKEGNLGGGDGPGKLTE